MFSDLTAPRSKDTLLPRTNVVEPSLPLQGGGGGSSFFEPSMGTNSPHASPYATEGHCCGTLEEGSTTREGLVSIFSQG